MTHVAFRNFQKDFTQRLASRSLRAVPGESINKDSPAIRQIRSRGVTELLKNHRFLRSVHRLVKNYTSRVQQKEEMISTHREFTSAVKQVRYAQRTLRTLQSRVRDIDQRLEPWLGLTRRDLFYEILEKVEDAARVMEKFESELVSSLPTHKRKPYYRTSKWESLIELYDHSSADLREKRTMQRLWTQINQKLLVLLTGRKISAMTRFTILSALLEAGGIGSIEPTALKQHFFEQQKANGGQTRQESPSQLKS